MASRIGFIGLGNMGAHMARNLIKNGKQLVVYDNLPSAMDALKADGAHTASSPADVAAACTTIVTMLPSSQHVLHVYDGPNGLFKEMQANTLCIDSSTIDPAVSVQMAAAAREKNNAIYLDAPVSGGVVAAQNAALTFMVGGSADGYALAEPLLKFMGKNVVHTGEPGTGQAAKICNNMLLAIGMIGTSEAMNLGQSLGLNPKMLAKIINMSSGRCWSSELYNPVPGVIEGTPACRGYSGGFGAALMAKVGQNDRSYVYMPIPDLQDLGLAQNASTATHSPTPLGSLAHQIYRLLAQNPDTATKDFSIVYQMLKKQQKVVP